MKTSNYLAKLPQEATIKSIQVLKDYDLISLDVSIPSQRLCPHCGSNDCVIKDSGTIQTVRHIPCNHRGTVVSFHKRRLLCRDCHSSFYETPYWIHPSLRMTQALYDGSKAFSGVSPLIPGVLYSFTGLFRRTPYFPGVSLNLLVFLVFTRFYWSSPLFTGVPYLNHQIFFKLHQLFLKLPITFIAMLDASMVAPYFQCYD